MPALFTQKDRMVASLQRQLDQARAWLRVDAGDRRACGFHKAKIAEIEAQIEKLLESE
jgi:hypothetical protein